MIFEHCLTFFEFLFRKKLIKNDAAEAWDSSRKLRQTNVTGSTQNYCNPTSVERVMAISPTPFLTARWTNDVNKVETNFSDTFFPGLCPGGKSIVFLVLRLFALKQARRPDGTPKSVTIRKVLVQLNGASKL